MSHVRFLPLARLSQGVRRFTGLLSQFEWDARKVDEWDKGERESLVSQLGAYQEQVTARLREMDDDLLFPPLGTAPHQWALGLLCELDDAMRVVQGVVWEIDEASAEPEVVAQAIKPLARQPGGILETLNRREQELANLLKLLPRTSEIGANDYRTEDPHWVVVGEDSRKAGPALYLFLKCMATVKERRLDVVASHLGIEEDSVHQAIRRANDKLKKWGVRCKFYAEGRKVKKKHIAKL